MKRLFIYISVFIGTALNLNSQTIDNTNYYNYKAANGVSTNWLRMCDAVPVIIDELLKSGISYSNIGVGDLIKLNDSTQVISRSSSTGELIKSSTHQVVLTVSFFKDQEIYGFIYEESHNSKLDPQHRDFLKENKYGYNQEERNIDHPTKDATTNFIKSLPTKNIFLLEETCYWYQTWPDGSDAPVSKKIILKILRQDIKNYLKKFKESVS